MCLAVPGRVVELSDRGDEQAVVDVDGAPQSVSLAVLTLDGRPVGVGDWVMVHTGFAVELVDEHDAQELLALRREMQAAVRGADR